MPTPDFIKDLRDDIGHRTLFVSVATVVVLDAQGRILMQRRADDGTWAVPGGFLDPGEQPAVAAVRETYEETGVRVEIDRLTGVRTTPPHTYPNGDVVQAVDLTFLARAVGGEARVNDGEALEVGWFPPDALPPIGPIHADLIKQALSGEERTWFATG
jgi:ADP-ribose pyrophosphatase YjhB (NUDIX family)